MVSQRSLKPGATGILSDYHYYSMIESIYLHVFGDRIEINQIPNVIKFNFVDFYETV